MSMLFVSQNFSETAQLLADKLDSRRVTSVPSGYKGLLINYGKWDSYPLPVGCKVLNKPEAIRLASNKFESLRKLSGADFKALKVPVVYKTYPDKPCIARTTTHRSGSGFWLCMNKHDSEEAINSGASYFVDYIPVKYEYRVHVFQGEVIDIRKKLPSENGDADRDKYVRSIHRGWKFVEVNMSHKIPDEVLSDCEQSLYNIGLDFGAIDLIRSDDDEYYLLEINSSPGISMDNTIQKYISKIKEVHDKCFAEEDEVKKDELLRALSRIERRTMKYNKPYVLINELKRELGL